MIGQDVRWIEDRHKVFERLPVDAVDAYWILITIALFPLRFTDGRHTKHVAKHLGVLFEAMARHTE